MSSVSPSNSTMSAIRRKVRRLTASPSEQNLRQTDIDQAVNTFYSQDFPSAIKTDQLKDTLEVFTEPNIDRYRVNINSRINTKQPVYVEGRESIFFKTLSEFYSLFPRYPIRNVPKSGNGVTTEFEFTIAAPFLANNVVIGTKDGGNNTIKVSDDGKNILNIVNFNDSTGDTDLSEVGTVNYVTGSFSIDFPIAPGNGQEIFVWTSPYVTGFPYCILFYKNEIIVRPVPDTVYKLEIQTYKSPTEFLSSSDTPEVNQWWQYIAYGASLEILRERQDTEGIQELMEGFQRQEALVLERQANEEIGIANETLLNSPGYLNYGNSFSEYWGG